LCRNGKLHKNGCPGSVMRLLTHWLLVWGMRDDGKVRNSRLEKTGDSSRWLHLVKCSKACQPLVRMGGIKEAVHVGEKRINGNRFDD
jgi:hypothetical protein